MESTSQYDESRPGATLPGVVGHQRTAAGSGSSQKSLSITTDNAQTQWKTAPNGDKDTDRNTTALNTKTQESTKGDSFEQKLRNSATSGNNEVTLDEANARFLKHLQQTYKLSKDLDAEVIAAPNTKREIKALILQLSNSVKGLIQWGRHTGKVSVPTTSRGNQTEVDKCMERVEMKTTGAQTYAIKENAASAGQVPEDTVLSPDRSRFEIPAAIKGLRQMLKAQGEAVGKLTEQVERMQNQHQQQQQQQQRSTMGKSNIPQKKTTKRTEPGEGNQHTDGRSGEKPNSTQIESQGQQQHQKDDTHNDERESEDAKDDEGFTVVNNRKAYKKQPKRVEALNDDKSRKTPRASKNQAIVINRPPGKKSYADTVREVKEVVEREKLTYDIITRRAKSGKIILEIPEKEHADHLAEVLKIRMGEAAGVRRPSPSIPLIFIGIEDSLDEAELKSALVELDGDLKDASDFTIREGRTGIRTAIIRVPLKAGTKLIHAKRIKVGWAYCRIKEFDAREQACNRCREKGHTVRECTGPEKRKCYRCKEIGHTIANCNKPDGRVGPKPNPGEQQSTAARAEENLPQNDH
ncbi:uncharacterized protein LOC126554613 [Aphis gossypii]|uniref:uncharacterized protein LOC126554613 n=1 Tax=Aphis gossypii TaxID=80765 RepID=UPI0021592CE7|nr:uncharacterized protein LOC126554613 [Aphis gossypii]